MGVIRGMLPAELLPSMLQLVDGMDDVDRAQLAISLCHACHSGYSLRLGDESQGLNIHQEYVNDRNKSVSA